MREVVVPRSVTDVAGVVGVACRRCVAVTGLVAVAWKGATGMPDGGAPVPLCLHLICDLNPNLIDERCAGGNGEGPRLCRGGDDRIVIPVEGGRSRRGTR